MQDGHGTIWLNGYHIYHVDWCRIAVIKSIESLLGGWSRIHLTSWLYSYFNCCMMSWYDYIGSIGSFINRHSPFVFSKSYCSLKELQVKLLHTRLAPNTVSQTCHFSTTTPCVVLFGCGKPGLAVTPNMIYSSFNIFMFAWFWLISPSKHALKLIGLVPAVKKAMTCIQQSMPVNNPGCSNRIHGTGIFT